MESGAIQDVLQVCGVMSAKENVDCKAMLDRIVAMLTKLGQRGYTFREEVGEYRAGCIDPDFDPDPERSLKTTNR